MDGAAGVGGVSGFSMGVTGGGARGFELGRTHSLSLADKSLEVKGDEVVWCCVGESLSGARGRGVAGSAGAEGEGTAAAGSFFTKPPPHLGRLDGIFGSGVNILGVEVEGSADAAGESGKRGGSSVFRGTNDFGGGTNAFGLSAMIDSVTGVIEILGFVGMPNTLDFGGGVCSSICVSVARGET